MSVLERFGELGRLGLGVCWGPCYYLEFWVKGCRQCIPLRWRHCMCLTFHFCRLLLLFVFTWGFLLLRLSSIDLSSIPFIFHWCCHSLRLSSKTVSSVEVNGLSIVTCKFLGSRTSNHSTDMSSEQFWTVSKNLQHITSISSSCIWYHF